MKHKLQKIKEESQELCAEISSDLRISKGHLEQIGDEYHRVTELSHAPMVVINEIDRQFAKATKLNDVDIAFLFVAAALQCIRQYIFTPTQERLNDQEAANKVKSGKEHSDRSHRLYNPSLEEIISNPVPFDITAGSRGVLKGYGSLGHRGATVGHDPLWGLLYGTANIATSTVTIWGKDIPVFMDSYHITTGSVPVRGGLGAKDVIPLSPSGKPILADTKKVLNYTIDKLLHKGMEGKTIVGVSVAKEIQHLRSDVHSTKSLPLPAISAISPRLAGDLAKYGVDMATVLDAGKQLVYAMAIDTLIALIHGFFYEDSAGRRNMYEIRTRRILLYSNLIASASNVVVAAVAQSLGMDGMRIVDWGGYLNTLHHIAFDAKFIHETKKDFLKNELYDRIVGTEYDFMKGDI